MPAAERGEPAPVFFLDTNVLVYSFSAEDAGKRDTSRALAESEGARISTQVLSELGNVLTRRFRVPAGEARARIASIAAGCEVVVVSPPMVLDAFRVMERWGYGFFDSQIVATALACGASILYSEDLHDGQTVDDRLVIRSPFRPRSEQRAKMYRAPARGARAGAKTRRVSL